MIPAMPFLRKHCQFHAFQASRYILCLWRTPDCTLREFRKSQFSSFLSPVPGEWWLNLFPSWNPLLWRKWRINQRNKGNSRLSSVHVQWESFKQKSNVIWLVLSRLPCVLKGWRGKRTHRGTHSPASRSLCLSPSLWLCSVRCHVQATAGAEWPHASYSPPPSSSAPAPEQSCLD